MGKEKNKRVVVKNKKSYLLIFFMFCFLTINITSISAVDILKPATLNQSYTIIQTCASCTFVNVTISNVNGIVFANQNMTNNGSGVWTFNMTPIIMSRHDVNGLGDLEGTDTSFATFFEVTPSGKTASTGESILYVLFSSFLFVVIYIISFVVFTMPSGNERDERGEEFKIVKVNKNLFYILALSSNNFIIKFPEWACS